MEYRPTRDGEQRAQRVHISVPVDAEKSEPLKPGDRFNPGGEVAQEGVQPPYDSPFRQQRPAFLPEGSKPARKSFHKLFRKTACPEHLPHLPRRSRGVGVDHDGWGVGRPSADGVTGSHKACDWVSSRFREPEPRQSMKVETSTGT